MSGALGGLLIGFIERPHSPEHRGSVTYGLIPLLRKRGARVELAHAENNLYHLDTDPPWDLVVLKSGSAAALHLAAAAEAWGIPSVNRSESTRLAKASWRARPSCNEPACRSRLRTWRGWVPASIARQHRSVGVWATATAPC